MESNITLFTTHCPKCKVLAAKLNSANVSYNIVEDIDEMQKLGINEVPCLKIKDEIINFVEAVKWINQLNTNMLG